MPLIDIDKVSVGSNRRPLKDQKVADLMRSIETSGLLNPITLDQNYLLIAGLHRLTACRLLGFTQIECKVVTCNSDQARLAEIDENLIRNELEALERSELWLERDQILDRMGLRAKAGDNQFTSKKGGEINSPPLKTTIELAQETGYTERTFQQGKQIARDIAPEVKAAIRGTSAAKSPQTLLKVARAGSEERRQAEQAERSLKTAKQNDSEAEQQAKIAAELRARQTELQLMTLHGVEAEKAAKQTARRQPRKGAASEELDLKIQAGDTWMLKRHLVYCGNTSGKEFRNCLPSNAAFAIVPPQTLWNHDYLIDEVKIVAVLRSQGDILNFCRAQQMPFRSERLIGDFYLALFSKQSIVVPDQPIRIEGIEGIVTYLLSLYTKPGHFVLNPGLGNGEVLMACERMERICFAGDDCLQRVGRSIDRWQKWVGKPAEKTDLLA